MEYSNENMHLKTGSSNSSLNVAALVQSFSACFLRVDVTVGGDPRGQKREAEIKYRAGALRLSKEMG